MENLLNEIEKTKHELKNEMTDMKTELRQEMTDMKTELRQEMADMKAELEQKMADMKAELRQEMLDMKTELEQKIKELGIMIEFEVQRKLDIILDYISLQQEKEDLKNKDMENLENRIQRNESIYIVFGKEVIYMLSIFQIKIVKYCRKLRE